MKNDKISLLAKWKTNSRELETLAELLKRKDTHVNLVIQTRLVDVCVMLEDDENEKRIGGEITERV